MYVTEKRNYGFEKNSTTYLINMQCWMCNYLAILAEHSISSAMILTVQQNIYGEFFNIYWPVGWRTAPGCSPCICLYCTGVTCSNPGGGTSQYREGFLRLDLVLSLGGERLRDLAARFLSLLRDLERPPLLLDRFLWSRERERRLLSRSLSLSRSERVWGGK